jgi:hypothetical protein
LAKGFGLATTAEGIEDADQLASLKANGCLEGQGYLFGKAIPANQIEALLRKPLPNMKVLSRAWDGKYDEAKREGLALPQRDMKCGRPTKAIKPYRGKHGRYPLIAEAADPPSSPLMNPKPRSAFHVFNVPAGILFPLFQPDLDQAADGGLGFRWNVRLFAARAQHPFSANYLHQSFARAKSSLYSIRRPTLLFSIGHFAFPHRELYVGESASALRL